MNIDDLTALAKQRGFFWPAAEIYGGASGLYDYGNIGALFKRRWEIVWLSYFVDTNPDYHLIDGANMLPESPLIHSGHASRFNDVLVGCGKCKTYYRADVLLADAGAKISEGAGSEEIDKAIRDNKLKCPKCKSIQFMPSKAFNMMLDLHLGPDKGESGYLRPETAQSAYLNFFREFNILRKQLPLGLAVIGRAYRNEISPRQGLYRMRELIQAELQIFFDPATWKPDISKVRGRKLNVVLYKKEPAVITVEDLITKHNIPEFYAYHMALIDAFYKDAIKVPEGKLHFLEKGGDEKAFYNKVHMDIEVDVESWGGFKEVGGLHYRGDYDLTQHSKGSKQDLAVLIDGKKVMPNVLELSFGVDRNLWMLIDVFFKKDEARSVLKIPPFMAPYHAGLFALQKDEGIDKMVENVHNKLRKSLKVFLDDSGSIGKRYARMDEIGTPFCITVDFDSANKQSKEYNTVTVRSRDDKSQVRVKVDELEHFIKEKVAFDPYKVFEFH